VADLLFAAGTAVEAALAKRVLAIATTRGTAGAVPAAAGGTGVGIVFQRQLAARFAVLAEPIVEGHERGRVVVRVQDAVDDLEEINQPPCRQSPLDRHLPIPLAQLALADVRMHDLGVALGGMGSHGHDVVGGLVGETLPVEDDLERSQMNVVHVDFVGFDGQRVLLRIALVVGEFLTEGQQFFVKVAERGDLFVRPCVRQNFQQRRAVDLQSAECAPQVAPLLPDRTTPTTRCCHGQPPHGILALLPDPDGQNRCGLLLLCANVRRM